MQAYWPIHKPECQRNEFADVVEGSDPKFARWMRQHGKLAVLKDDEVERLERAAVATTGYTKSEVMDSMYGRLEPKPARKLLAPLAVPPRLKTPTARIGPEDTS